jgi:hypothetical protein
MPRLTALLLLSLCACAATAQSVRPVDEPVVRYHLGDESGQDESGNSSFAAPEFNDSTWPIAQDGTYPVPAFQSDGVVWLRIHLPVPFGISPPFALGLHHSPDAQEIFAEGRSIDRQGKLPPNPAATVYSISVLPLPSEAIAQAALHYGQDDDITVLTVTRMGTITA